jgi:signal transduction histidine kinase
VEKVGGERIWPADLDGDGDDELLLLGVDSTRGLASRLLFEDDGRVIEQTNHPGRVGAPWVLDVWGDARPEVVVPVVRDDSLFLSVTSGEGRKLFAFLLVTGKPRSEPDGELPWDPVVSGVWSVDVDGDGERDLVTSVTTMYARYPRGVFANRLPDGERIGEALIGAPTVATLFADFDEDGDPELLAATQRTRHGGDVAGIADSLSHLILFELTPTPRVAWSRRLDGGDVPALGWTAPEGDPDREVIVASGLGRLVVELLDPVTGRVTLRRALEGRFWDPAIVDLDRDLRPEIVAARVDRPTVARVDSDLATVTEVPGHVNPTYASTWPDLDGDGVAELVFRTPSGFALFDARLHVKAVVAGGEMTGVQYRGLMRPAHLLYDSDGLARVATLQPNPWFLVVRFGPGALAVLLPLGAWFLVTHLRRLGYRIRVVHAAGMEALDAGGLGVLVLDVRGRVRWRGSGAGQALGPGGGRASDLDDLATASPELASYCQGLLAADPARGRTEGVTLRRANGGGALRLSARPVIIGSAGDPHWLVRIDGGEAPSNGAARTWPMFAQRIAHSIKNPLTHMLLTVQRLQTEYRERAPAVADRLDPYAERIQDGIGQLRRLTSSFLKLVDLASPELEAVDPARLVQEYAEHERARLPPDIRLTVYAADDLPPACVDQDQIRLALDNLVTNAVNALDAGGTITLTVTPVLGVDLDGGGCPGDYVQIEVLDTGKGLSADLVDRAFEVGFTTSEDGSGLGLAIVRKIVADHGGLITLQSTPGVGTSVTIHLPIAGPVPALERASVEGAS